MISLDDSPWYKSAIEGLTGGTDYYYLRPNMLDAKFEQNTLVHSNFGLP